MDAGGHRIAVADDSNRHGRDIAGQSRRGP